MYTREWENKCLWKDRIRHTTFITSEYPQWLSLASIVSIYVVFLKIDVRLNIIVTKSLTNNITIEQVSSIASLNLILNTYIYLGMGVCSFYQNSFNHTVCTYQEIDSFLSNHVLIHDKVLQGVPRVIKPPPPFYNRLGTPAYTQVVFVYFKISTDTQSPPKIITTLQTAFKLHNCSSDSGKLHQSRVLKGYRWY